MPCDLEVVEDRILPVVQLHNLFLIRRDQGNIFLYLLVNRLVVDMDVRERIVQEISEDGGGLAVLGEEQLDAL